VNPTKPARVPRPAALHAALAAACVAAAVALGGCAPPPRQGAGDGPPVSRLSIHLPADAPAAVDDGRPAIAVSRRGDRIVYVARRGGATELRLRPIEKFEAIPLPGTVGAADPFLSPEGDRIGFFAGGRLRTIALGSLAVTTVCEVRGPSAGGAWSADDTIVFAAGGDLWRVPAAGGEPARIGLALGGAGRGTSSPDAVPLWPDVTAAGSTIVFTLRGGGPGGPFSVAAYHPARGEVRTLVERAVSGRIAASGELLAVMEGNLVAVPFDAAALAVRGKAVPVLEGVLADPRTGAAQYALSATGALVYAPADPAAEERALLWVDRSGGERPIVETRRRYELPRLSADGRRLAIGIAEGDALTLWLHETGGGAPRRYPLEGSGALAVFAPDGGSLVYVAPRAGAWTLFRRPSDPEAARAAQPDLLMSGEHPLSPTSFSPSGDRLAVTEVRPDTRGDILILPLPPEGGAGGPRPFLRTRADEWGAAFSPDGRYLAYTSNATGRNEVYVAPIAGPGAIRLSRDGGYGPIWSRDEREIVFRSGDAVLAVPIRLRPAFAAAGAPAVLFRGPYAGASAGWPNYDLAPDGRRFVMIRGREDAGAARRLDVVLGFPEEVRRAVARAQE
jgi:Tol biopolymer transport system component